RIDDLNSQKLQELMQFGMKTNTFREEIVSILESEDVTQKLLAAETQLINFIDSKFQDNRLNTLLNIINECRQKLGSSKLPPVPINVSYIKDQLDTKLDTKLDVLSKDDNVKDKTLYNLLSTIKDGEVSITPLQPLINNYNNITFDKQIKIPKTKSDKTHLVCYTIPSPTCPISKSIKLSGCEEKSCV